MSIAEKLSEIAEKVPLVFKAGESAEAARCAVKHFVTTVVGDGTGTLVFDMPFEPDFISVASFNPFAVKKADQLIFVMRDFKSFGRLAGTGVYCITGNYDTRLRLFAQSAAAKRFVIENGVCTVHNFGTSDSGNNLVFTDGEEYVITAIKYTDKTDKEYISEYILALPYEGGTIEISTLKKESVFTEEEWGTLIAKQPNWTINLV